VPRASSGTLLGVILSYFVGRVREGGSCQEIMKGKVSRAGPSLVAEGSQCAKMMVRTEITGQRINAKGRRKWGRQVGDGGRERGN